MSYLLIMLFSTIDYLFTLYHMSHGAQELNPIMQGIMAQPFWVSFIVKNGWTASFLIMLFELEMKYGSKLIRWGKMTLIAAYGLVIGYHLILIYISCQAFSIVL